MDYRFLGDTGLSVSCLGLGTLTSGGPNEHREAERIISKALEQGINFFDTANVYCGGESEKILGKTLKSIRDHVVILTKVGRAMGEGPNEEGLSRVHIVKQLEQSLRRLETDWIDLYLIHAEDASTGLAEVIYTLDNLVRQGKIRYFGCSNLMPFNIVESLWCSDRLKLMRFCCVEDEYNLLNRQVELETIPICQQHNMGFIAYSPLARGVLTGKYVEHAPLPEDSRASRGDRIITKDLTGEKFSVLDKIKAIFSEYDANLGQCAISWLLHQDFVTSVILGPRTLDQFLDNLGSMNVNLSDKTLRALSEMRPYRDWGAPARRCPI